MSLNNISENAKRKKMDNPSVSIIIPTIGRPSLKNTIESVLSQTYDNITQIIITDDTDKGNVKEIADFYKKKDNRIIYTQNRKYEHGPTGNKNNGLDFALADFVGILDDDDILFEDAVEELIKVYREKGYEVLWANCLRSDGKGFSGKSYGKSEEVLYQDVICGKYEGEYWMLLKRNLIGEDRFYDQTWSGEDLLWWKVWKKIGKLYYVDRPVRIYQIEHQDRVSVAYTRNPIRTLLFYNRILELYGDDMKAVCPRNFIRFAFIGCYFAKLAGDYKSIFKLWLRAYKAKRNAFWFTMPYLVFLLVVPKKAVVYILENLKLKRTWKMLILI